MAVKDIRQYFNEVCDQYHEMLEEIRDFEKEAEQGLIEPERLDQIKDSIKPLVNNYQTLSWIMFLLNKPVKKSKHKGYEQRNQKILKSLDPRYSKDGILQENINTLENLTKIVEGK